MNDKKGIILTGAVIGLFGGLLVLFGNPANMGICVACFIRDIAGSIGLHRAGVVQYLRPEIFGFVLGAFIIAKIKGEFKVTGGSSPISRFVIAMFVMIGALVFLGCPLRMVLRLAGGDWNAILGIVGFILGVLVGTQFLKRGFTLGRSYSINKTSGYILPLIMVLFLIFRIIKPGFIIFSESGPGASFAPWIIALIAGLVIGVLGQRSRICMAGGIRDLYLIKDSHLITGFISIFVFAFIINIIFGNFDPGFIGQPAAHTDWLWNLLGMFLVGFGSVLLGGCPLRQTILAGEGNTDSAIAFFGYLVGAAVSHNFGLAGSGSGVAFAGKFTVIFGIVVVTLIAVSSIKFSKSY